MAEPALFLFGVSNTSSYGAPNTVTVDSGTVMVAKCFSIDNTTVPLLAILTIVH